MSIPLKSFQSISPFTCHSDCQSMTFPGKDTGGWPPTTSTYVSPLHVVFSSVQSCPTLCDPMNHSMPGLPVHHHLPEFTQTHVHRVGDAIQPSHPLSSPFPPAPNPSQHQSFSNESTLRMRWPKYWSFSFSIIPSCREPARESLP